VSETFVEPATMEEAESRVLGLTADIQRIQTQLGSYNATLKTGERMDVREWNAWRQKAKTALAFKTEELRAVKAWVKAHRPRPTPGADRGGAAPPGPGTVRELGSAVVVASDRLRDHAAFLEGLVADLRAENAELRHRLSGCECGRPGRTT
jgi:hypothetical protein